jgi:hypothetical protein
MVPHRHHHYAAVDQGLKPIPKCYVTRRCSKIPKPHHTYIHTAGGRASSFVHVSPLLFLTLCCMAQWTATAETTWLRPAHSISISSHTYGLVYTWLVSSGTLTSVRAGAQALRRAWHRKGSGRVHSASPWELRTNQHRVAPANVWYTTADSATNNSRAHGRLDTCRVQGSRRAKVTFLQATLALKRRP